MFGGKWGRTAKAGVLAGAVALLANVTEAQQSAPIHLKSKDGSIAISGKLITFERNVYVVDVDGIGVLKLESSDVECTGALCPVVRQYGPQFGIYGSRTVGTTLVPNLLRGYAKHVGASFEIVHTADPAERVVRLTNADGTLRAEVDLQTRGSGSAFPALAEGKAAIGVADRRMKDKDLAKLQAAGIGELRDTGSEVVLGVDGIVVILNKDNPVRNLTTSELARIWSGEITNWLELGGGDVPIKVNSFGEGSGDRAIFLDRIVHPNGRDEKRDVDRFKAYQDMVNAVMAHRGGIGFVGRWLALANDVRLLDIREPCGLLSPPTDFRMKIEGYALSRRLYMYTRPGDLHPEAEAFMAWTRTPDAQPYIAEAGFIDRELERMRLEDMGMMLVHTAAVEPDFNGVQYSDMMRQLRGADRLSISFRFATGSSVLDPESVRNLRELAERMEGGEFDGLEVLLVGFADSVGAQARNTELALARSYAVRDILRRELQPATAERLRLVPLSYGELLPLSCNGDDVGRARNRRVEVWLRLPDSRTAGR